MLGLPRARKTSLPPTMAPPDGDELDAEMTVTPNGHAEGGADLVDGGGDRVFLSESSVSLAVAMARAEARGRQHILVPLPKSKHLVDGVACFFQVLTSLILTVRLSLSV